MIKNYFKIALRNLRKNRVYGFINVMGLAMSMACCILIFTLVKYHLSFDNFHKDSDRIYRFVTEQHRDEISYAVSVPPPFGKAFRTDYDFDEQVARTVISSNSLISIKQGEEIKKFKEPEGASFAEPEFFEIFNFPFLNGDKKTSLTEPNTAVITERLAKKYFGTENVVNKTLRYENRIDFKITGILKDIPTNTDFKSEIYLSWATLQSQNDWYAKDDSWGGISTDLRCFTRLRPNVTVGQIEKLLPAYVTKYRPKSKNVHHYKLQPLAEVHFDGRYGGVMEKRNLWILSFIGLFLIITACVNFINLATAQALKRAKEVGIRKVLGSLRGQLFWQFIAETALITIIASVAAVALSFFALPYVNELFKTQMIIPVLSDPLWITFLPLLALLVIFLAGSYPGLILSGFQPVSAIKGKLSQQHIGGFNTRRTLIITQFTISLVLIIGMIVITQQMQYAKKSDLGFNKDAIVMMPLGFDSVSNAQKTLGNQLAAIPGVQSVSQCYAAPSSNESRNTSIRFDSRTEEEPFRTSFKAADDQYLKTFDLQLVAGRNIFPSDTAREFLINETLVKKLGLKSPEEALGKKIYFYGNLSASITGVVKDFHDVSFHGDVNAVAITTHAENYTNYAVKININNIKSILPALEKTWSSMHPDKIYEYQFLDEKIAEFYETEETMLKLITTFSFIAIFIGCLGLYGLVSFMAAQKTKEIGIRKVLGSSITEILWIFGKEFSRLIAIAFLIAAPFAWWLMNSWLQDFKFRISIGIGVFVLAIAIILLIAGVTVVYQSIKAAMANPVKSLRTE
jgi:predicted permease